MGSSSYKLSNRGSATEKRINVTFQISSEKDTCLQRARLEGPFSLPKGIFDESSLSPPKAVKVTKMLCATQDSWILQAAQIQQSHWNHYVSYT